MEGACSASVHEVDVKCASLNIQPHVRRTPLREESVDAMLTTRTERSKDALTCLPAKISPCLLKNLSLAPHDEQSLVRLLIRPFCAMTINSKKDRSSGHLTPFLSNPCWITRQNSHHVGWFCTRRLIHNRHSDESRPRKSRTEGRDKALSGKSKIPTQHLNFLFAVQCVFVG